MIKKATNKMKILKTVLIICFSLLVVGCSTFKGGNEKWPLPEKPKTLSVQVIPLEELNVDIEGFYMEREDAENLATNVEELKAYTKKMEILIKKMKKYYGAK